MKKKCILIVSLICFLFSVEIVGGTSLAEKKRQYKELSLMIENPKVLWLPTSIFLDDIEFITVEQVKRNITKNLLANPQFHLKGSDEFIRRYLRTTLKTWIQFSNLSKQIAKESLLPLLAEEIKQAEEQNQEDRGQTADAGAIGLSPLGELLTQLNSPEHMQSLSFSENLDQVVAENSEELYGSCPKSNPRKTSVWRAYANGVSGGSTYTRCAYFGGEGSHIQSEMPYQNGQKNGTALFWVKRLATNSYYFSQREHWKNDLKDGVVKSYTWNSKTDAPFLSQVLRYTKGQQDGDCVYYKVNGEWTKITWKKGVSEKIYYYRNDNSSRCGNKDHATGRWRDCTTGRLW